MRKHIGEKIEIIYLDRKGQITQRKIRIHDMKDQRIKATCLETGKPRIFLEDRILSWRVVKGGRMTAS